jgi:hypothetical protein
MRQFSGAKILLWLCAVLTVGVVGFGIKKTLAATNPPALKEGTYLQGQTLSVWPSWTVLGNALGEALPSDPINQLGKAGTCVSSTNIFCVADTQCPDGQHCVLHDPNTGWSTENRRFSFACATSSYAYRYIDISTSTYEVRARLEETGLEIPNWNDFMEAFVNPSIVKFDPSGICNSDQEISTFATGTCGDGAVNLVNNEECDPPKRTRYGACGAEQGHPNEVGVDVCNAQCKWVPSSTPYISCSALSKCGNGIVESGESCDDGVLNGKYNHCNAACSGKSSLGWCGNGTKEPAYELCDPGTGGDMYAFNRTSSCAWDCQHYGRYCGDGKVEQEIDEIPGALGPEVGGVHSIVSKMGKPIQVIEHEVNQTYPECNRDEGGRVSCNDNIWDYKIIFDQAGSYSVQFFTANDNSKDLSGFADSLCSAPGVQHHLIVSADGIVLGNYCAEAKPAAQQGTAYAFKITSAGQHTITLKWDNDFYDDPSHSDSNLKIIKALLIRNIEECDGNKTCTVGGKQGTIFCNSQCKFAYPPDPQDGYCSTTKAAPVAPPGTCGDGVVDSGEACDKGLANNGKACTPAYDKPCTYCSADCKHTIDVQPVQYCGNGIVEGPEECDMDRSTGVIYRTRTSVCHDDSIRCRAESLFLLGYGWDVAHNGLRVRTCAEDTPSDYYGFWKGTRECASCKLVDHCVACGYDADSGVEVSGGKIMNVLEPVSTNPLYGLPVAPPPDVDGIVRCPGTSQDLPLWQCPENNSLRDPKIHLLIAPTNTNPASGVFAGGKAWRVPFENTYYLAAVPGDSNGRYSRTPTKLNASAICSIASPQYKLQFNNDSNPLHWQPFTVIEDKFNDKPWKYDLVLSPVIGKSEISPGILVGRPRDVRVVLSWVGGSEFYGGFLMPMSRTDRNQDVLIEGPTFGSNISAGLQYFNNNPFHGIWYHDLGFTANQMNEEAFTVDISKMEAGLYVFYVRSVSGPLSQLRSAAKLRVDVYMPEDVARFNPPDNYFAQPAQTFYLATAIPSDNPQASYLQVFNLLAVGENATKDNIMDVNSIVTDPKFFTYTASCVGRPGKICRASWGVCDVAEYCTADSDVCPDDTFKPAGAYCDSVNGGKPCYDNNATCNGMSPDCTQTSLYKSAGVVCGAADACNNPPTCEGNLFDCPNNGTPMQQGTPCGDLCQGYHCSHGSCIAGTPVDCSSGNTCINDTCDQATGACLPKPEGTACTASGGYSGTCHTNLAMGPVPYCRCTQTTCAAQGKNCGTIPDGCGGNLNCGACAGGNTCTNNVCACVPTTCAAQGKNCGTISNGCGSQLNCGSCVSPQTCGGGGNANVCGCTPTTCAAHGSNCGTIPNGCGSTLSCGTCLGLINSCDISVTYPLCNGNWPSVATVNPASINRLAPVAATITGDDYWTQQTPTGCTAGPSKVYIQKSGSSAVSVTIQSWSNTSIVFTIPAGLPAGSYTVYVDRCNPYSTKTRSVGNKSISLNLY